MLLSAEFWEDGYVLKSGRNQLHRYELDLLVPEDITCDAFLGALYGALQQVLANHYGMDPQDQISGIAYHDYLAMMDPDDPAYHGRWIRPRIVQNIRLRAAAVQYAAQRHKAARLDHHYPVDQTYAELSDEEKMRLGWLVCWQVFLECYQAYAAGYPAADNVLNAQTLLSRKYRCHPVIARGTIPFSHSSKTHMAQIPLLWLQQRDHGAVTLKDLGFADGSRLIFDPVLWHQNVQMTVEEIAPPENLASRPALSTIHTEPISILPPDVPPRLEASPIAPVILPPLIATGSVLAAFAAVGMDAQPEHLAVLGGTIAVSTVASGLVNHGLQQNAQKQAMKSWCAPYESYIRSVLAQIRQQQEDDSNTLHQIYPPALGPGTTLTKKALAVSGDMYSRSPFDSDFLHVRLGTTIPGSCLTASRFPVVGQIAGQQFMGIRYRNLRTDSGEPFALELSDSHGNYTATGRDLAELPQAIANAYACLEHAPVLLDLKQTPALGLAVNPRMEFAPFLANFLLDLCFYHLPEDLQVVMLCPPVSDWKQRHARMARYKHLPHFRGLLEDRSAFAFDPDTAWILLDAVRERIQQDTGGPHILLIAEYPYELSRHPLWAGLAKGTCQNLTTVICQHHVEKLPRFCSQIIQAVEPDEWYLLPRFSSGLASACPEMAFRADPPAALDADASWNRETDPHYQAFRCLSATYYHKIANAGLPAQAEVLRMLGLPDDRKQSGDAHATHMESAASYASALNANLSTLIRRNWKHPNELSTSIGLNAHGPVKLNLTDSGDGPHLGIFGQEKSGKTEAAVTLMLSLCTRLPSTELQLDVVDLSMALSKRVGDLPHVRCIPDTACSSVNGAVDLLQDYFSKLNREIADRRYTMMKSHHSDIDTYNAARRKRKKTTIPHRFVILEDYDKLSDIISGNGSWNLDTVLQNCIDSGSGLGIHLILLSAEPNRVLSQKLLDSIPTRLCLKVRDDETSRSIIGTSFAADPRMSQIGRAYLLRKNSTSPESLQIGYADTDIISGPYKPFQITLVSPGDVCIPFFRSDTYVPNPNWSPYTPRQNPAENDQAAGHKGKHADKVPGWVGDKQNANHADEIPDWVKRQQYAGHADEIPDWVKRQQNAGHADEIPDWVKRQQHAGHADEIPDWAKRQQYAGPSDAIPRWVKGKQNAAHTAEIPRPDAVLEKHTPIGITQEQCLIRIIQNCHQKST